MRLPDASWAHAASASSQAAAGAVRPNGGGGFTRLWREVDAEVRHFIEHGGEQTPAMSVEGAWQRWRLNPVAAGNRSESVTAEGASPADRAAFLADIQAPAADAARQLGVAPELVVAHAALESGWGARPLRNSDGSNSHNFFGIKAGGNWRGAVLDAMTTEHEQGQDVKRAERFRSYPDMASAMRDYAQLLLGNPRYQTALNAGGDAEAFAQGLARGGYATDPDYARKLVRVARQLQSGE